MTNNEKIEQIDEQRLVDDDRMHAWLAERVYLSRTTILITWNESKRRITTLIDLTNGKKRYKTGFCHCCDHSNYPNGKFIDPTTDHSAKQMENGSWKCGVCVAAEENTKKLLRLMKG